MRLPCNCVNNNKKKKQHTNMRPTWNTLCSLWGFTSVVRVSKDIISINDLSLNEDVGTVLISP